MIIDFHTHTFPPHLAASTLKKLGEAAYITSFAEGTEEALSASMKQAGIGLSVVLPVATSPKQVPSINRSTLERYEDCLERNLLFFGAMHPDYPQWKEELDLLARSGLKGIKIHPPYQNVALDDPRYLRILERAGELGLVVVTHGGRDIGFPDSLLATPDRVRRALEQAGPVTLVAAHMGGWRCWEEVRALLADTPVYLDTSFSAGELVGWDRSHYSPEEAALLDRQAYVDMIGTFGAHRVLFGSDSPWTDQKASLDWISSLPLTPEERSAILGENAQRLLKL